MKGSVEYLSKSNKTINVEWAGYAHLVKDEKDNGKVKMDFYQAYLAADTQFD